MSLPPLLRHLPEGDDPDELLMGFLDYADELGLSLYPAQEEAILELLSGSNVILNTPTGSGKSLVAAAAHFSGLARGAKSWYTAPIKALVSEKFFDLCRAFGSDRVGMITGDASVNPQAPIICCTAEILANLALRDGPHAPADIVVMDEFHYYSDRDRGWAWQVPLLELPQAQFLLMSATLGPTDHFETYLADLTGRDSVTVKETVRPVPLEYSYVTTPMHETIDKLLELRQAPVYIVHFTQRSATDTAQALTSIDVLTKEEKTAVKAAVGGFRFDSAFGTDLKRYVMAGIGVHHAGLLPKYRLLVEKLAQDGLLKVICGTDTLGVGVNVPIRTVLFTQLCKYDGQRTRTLTIRDFQQIAGRAGRKGFDDIGFVWCQAPGHVVENIRLEDKAGDDTKKLRKLKRKKPPERGYVHWDDKVFTKLAEGEPEALRSRFSVSHSLLLHLLDRPGDGCKATRELLVKNHDERPRQRSNIRRAIAMYRALVEADIIELLDETDSDGRLVRVNIDLQDDFALNQPLSLFAVEFLDVIDIEDPSHALDVVTVVESVLENPGVVLARQLDVAKGELINQLKMDGVEYEQRMERLEEVTWPQPNSEELWAAFNIWAVHHPWIGANTVRPKSIVRDMFERAMTFKEYVNHYGLKGVEGVLLRYLSDGYKALSQTVPQGKRSDDVVDIIEWLGAMVRHVDSSLIDEWEKLTKPEDGPGEVRPPEPVDITTNTRAFTVMVRNEAFRWLTLLAGEQYGSLSEMLRATKTRWSADELAETFAPYWNEYDDLATGAVARGTDYFEVSRGSEEWNVIQIIADPEDHREWRLRIRVDLELSRGGDRPALELSGIERL